ncbi:hypothetical protein [Paenibacillus guangzhouensis]|nr:hypothetical protein [Paenibacillus guangzhouensis]
MPQNDAHDEEYTNPGRGWLIGGGLSLLLWIIIIFTVRALFQ